MQHSKTSRVMDLFNLFWDPAKKSENLHFEKAVSFAGYTSSIPLWITIMLFVCLFAFVLFWKIEGAFCSRSCNIPLSSQYHYFLLKPLVVMHKEGIVSG